MDRVEVVSAEPGGRPTELSIGALHIAAIGIPHEGWPDYHADVENIVFSITLDSQTTVAHMGDADPLTDHFTGSEAYWRLNHHHLVLPPYWFFLREQGRQVLSQIVDAEYAVGTHVPTKIPDEADSRPPEFEGFDLFTQPGEIRIIRPEP